MFILNKSNNFVNMKKAERFLAQAKHAGYDIPQKYLTKYELPQYQDFVILGKCLQALEKKLSMADRKQVRFIMSQLLAKWRPPLEKEIDRILKK